MKLVIWFSNRRTNNFGACLRCKYDLECDDSFSFDQMRSSHHTVFAYTLHAASEESTDSDGPQDYFSVRAALGGSLSMTTAAAAHGSGQPNDTRIQ